MSGGHFLDNCEVNAVLERMPLKTCSKCRNTKPKSEFSIDRQKKDGLASGCKDCMRDASRKKYARNLDHERKRSKTYRENNQEKELARSLRYRSLNRKQMNAASKAYYDKNKKKCLLLSKEWMLKNQERVRMVRAKYVRNRRASDINFRLAGSVRSSINKRLKSKKTYRTLELIGCSIDELKAHLEGQFEAGMTWENYGRNGWHIDHIIPCCKFDMSDKEQMFRCFHFSNLQPLWAIDNHKKGGRYVGRLF